MIFQPGQDRYDSLQMTLRPSTFDLGLCRDR